LFKLTILAATILGAALSGSATAELFVIQIPRLSALAALLAARMLATLLTTLRISSWCLLTLTLTLTLALAARASSDVVVLQHVIFHSVIRHLCSYLPTCSMVNTTCSLSTRVPSAK
jgi:hypothetical protein